MYKIHSVKWVIWLGVILLVCLPHPIQCQVEDLCSVSGCSCNTLSGDLIEVNCQCSTGQVRLLLLLFFALNLAFFALNLAFLVLYLASGSYKGQIKPKAVWALCCFSQKSNKIICFICREKEKGNKTNSFIRFWENLWRANLLLVLSDPGSLAFILFTSD